MLVQTSWTSLWTDMPTTAGIRMFQMFVSHAGILPDIKVKVSSLAATPVITVPLHRQQMTEYTELGLTWRNWTVE